MIQAPRKTLLASATTCALIAAAPALAGGLTLYEVGTADVGLASAGYGARAQDASTVLTNPAGMTRLDGSQLLLGVQALYGKMDFSLGAGTSPQLGLESGGNPIGWFPGGGAFYTYSLSPDVKLGFALTGNFGLSVKYDDGWAGRYYLQKATLLGISLLPSIAWKATDKLSLGASLNVMYGIMKNTVAVNNIFGNPDGQLTLDNNTWGVGANLGLLYEFTPGTRVGLVYNSQVKLDFSPQAQFTGLAPLLGAVLNARGLPGATVDLGVTVPQGVMLSGFHQVDDKLALLASAGWQQWSKFGKVDVGIESNNPVGFTTSLDFKDTWHLALGGQYKVNQPWTLNFGVAYDSGFHDSSNVSPALPANAAWRFGVGAQNQVDKSFSWGVSAEYIYGGSLDVNKQATVPYLLGGRGNLVGSYDPRMLFLAANVSWKF